MIPELSIIIPAYNEEKRISYTLKQYVSYFDSVMKDRYDLFVVINGCTDNTLLIVKTFAKTHRQVKYSDIGKVQGKGAAIIHGFKLVKGRHIGFVDADCATPPRAFYDLYKHIKEHDGVIASRWMRQSLITPKQPLLRRVASRCFNLLVRLLFFLPYTDTQTGAKLFTKKAVTSILPHLGITRWAFDVDLLYLLKKRGFLVCEIPTEWHDDPYSHLKLGRVSLEMFSSVIRLRLIYSPFTFIVTLYDAFVRLTFGK